MTKKNIPTPRCSTCGEASGRDYISDETSYRCPNCGTEMRYLPAGELLTTSGSDVKKNNGWITTFSVLSSELYSSRAMACIGGLIVVLVISFLFLGKIGIEGAILCFGSGGLLIILGIRKLIRQKKKMKMAVGRYPHWNK